MVERTVPTKPFSVKNPLDRRLRGGGHGPLASPLNTPLAVGAAIGIADVLVTWHIIMLLVTPTSVCDIELDSQKWQQLNLSHAMQCYQHLVCLYKAALDNRL